MKIVPETLRKLRKARQLGQQGLADRARVDKKTIARIEAGRGGEARESTVTDIAKALKVNPLVLAEGPESEAMREEDLRKHGYRRASLHFRGETMLAYDLVRDRYGVQMWNVIDAAPFLFTLLAEMSLAERRSRLDEMVAAWEAYRPTVPEHLRHDAGGRDSEGFQAEEDSIERRDLFGRTIEEEDELEMRANDTYYADDRNPFLDFLAKRAEELGPDNDAVQCEHMYLSGNGLFGWRLFDAYLTRLTGGSPRARYALCHGHVRLAQIPEHLRGEREDDDVADERTRWLEDRVPDDDWAEAERRFNVDLETLVTDESKKGEHN